MKVAIVGLGLIGGSIAKDLRAKGFATSLIGVDANETNGHTALSLGLVDSVLPLTQALQKAQVVVLAIPVNAMCRLLPEILDGITEGTVVLDTGSTKSAICKSVMNHPRRSQFVAAHPLAGTENSGPTAALQGLFQDKMTILCEVDKSSSAAVKIAEDIFRHLGMRINYMDSEEHDRHVAYVSHLSHVSSFLLGQTVLDIEKDEKNIFDLASTGFASTVRLAKSSPDMWAPIFDQNVEYLSQALLEYIMHLQRFHYHLMKRDTQELHRIMTKANEIRRVLDNKKA